MSSCEQGIVAILMRASPQFQAWQFLAV